MRLLVIFGFSIFLFNFSAALCAAAETSSSGAMRWFKGNTHTHTTLSDGDSTPGLVARWYRNNGYDFLFLTDHNVLTEITDLQREITAENLADGKKPFLLIPGEEVSNTFKGPDRGYAIHTSGLDTKTTIGRNKGTTKLEILQMSIDGIRAAGGLPSVNHPNFQWALTADDLFAMKNLRHYEIYNGHPKVNNRGGGGVLSTEAMWDSLLTRGRLFYGVAVDDAHHFKRFAKDQSNPGKGWVVVRAQELTPSAIIRGLAEGNFYSSTGVELDDVATTGGMQLGLAIHKQGDFKFLTEFFGENGKLLKSDETTAPVCQMQPNDVYVRARVTSSNGDFAWTQPHFAPGKQPTM